MKNFKILAVRSTGSLWEIDRLCVLIFPIPNDPLMRFWSWLLLLSIFLCTFFPSQLEPVGFIKEIPLQTGNYFFGNLNNSRAVMNYDGSFLIFKRHSVWHFDVNGALIQSFGKEGQGPGEFQRVLGGVFTRDGLYFIYDSSTNTAKLFSAQGTFLLANPITPIRDILYLDGQIYGTSLRHMLKHFGTIRKRGIIPAEVMDDLKSGTVFFRFELDNNSRLTMEDQGFFNYTEPIIKSWFLWSWHFLRADQENFYIMQAMENKVYVFDRKSRKYKNSFLAQLNYYEEPPTPLQVPQDNERRRVYLDSWSRIYTFDKLRNGFLIGYNVPNTSTRDERIYTFQKIDDTGSTASQPFESKDILIGIHKDKIYFLELDDSGADVSYSIKVYR